MDAQQLLTLPEALRWVPGVFDQNSRSGFERFTIRGFLAGHSVFQDGLRVDPRFWIGQELFGMDRIEGRSRDSDRHRSRYSARRHHRVKAAPPSRPVREASPWTSR